MLTKETIKNLITPFRIVLAIAIILAGIVVYEFGWKKLENSIYQKGVTAGMTEINNLVISQFLNTGKIGLTLPVNSEGKYDPNSTTTVTIILVPQVNPTTTK